jgi:hypothetical protein
MTQVIVDNLQIVLKYRERIFILLVALILTFSTYYVYIVQSTIVNVVAKEKIVKQIRERSTQVSELESIYFKTKNQINIELAHSRGFKDGEVSNFISKKSLTAFVSK